MRFIVMLYLNIVSYARQQGRTAPRFVVNYWQIGYTSYPHAGAEWPGAQVHFIHYANRVKNSANLSQ